jgi:hypothetical protein
VILGTLIFVVSSYFGRMPQKKGSFEELKMLLNLVKTGLKTKK